MNAILGEDCDVADDVELGEQPLTERGQVKIGDRATIREGVRIYANVTIGDDLVTGHDALIREQTVIGDEAVVGTDVVIEGHVDIGDRAKLETGVFIPTETEIEDNAFLGPHAVLTNDKYPQRRRAEYEPAGPTLGDNVTIGANATILPGVEIGDGAMIGAGAVVTEDIPAWSSAVGNPAKIEPLPERLQEPNRSI